MAGIGFELKKIIDKDGYFSKTRTYFMSSLITIGPMIISILSFLIMQDILKKVGETYLNIQLFSSIIIYAFFISYILSNGISMFISRFVSDCIYEKKIGYIFESLIGSIIIYSISALIITSLLFINSTLDIYIKLATVMITIIIGIIWIEVVYLSAVKDYLKIVLGFVIGMLIITLGTIFGIKFINMPKLYIALLATLIGYIFISIMFIGIIYKAFGFDSLKLSRCMKFMESLDKYFELFLIGIFLALGAYSHNLIIWMTDSATVVDNTFRVASFYDVPSFYAFLSVIPAVVIFTVKVETLIYPKYKEFYNFVRDTGSINEIKRAKKELIDCVVMHMTHMIEVQFIGSFACIVLGFKLLPYMGFLSDSIEIFGILTLGALAYICMNFLIIMLLYFDARSESLKIATVFLITTIVLSIITVFIGKDFYGYGFFFSSIISMVFAFNEINKFFNRIEYHIFADQPMFNIKKKGIFSSIYGLFNKNKVV
ncbi:exopolysaccharide Pel transporter PelG [Romboutsia sp. 1001216sp1]|uniref:exopolysaccharide Pel transporter PelG n=1 Tax=unclassified Romboutsia TaxID=2626894 RepID=UPI0018A98553|nr:MULTISPECIES: exopolysaccharide Pel transporter PelG [unclassified Romboutsia]MDB8794822.1 exopolysaccharide Pel transporter PelG [Romboutsia sp. 1001216sp1]MDB8796597.1 exopolysaccharide Pel transporter PelG [Romboutsia sp. 1001216sp1]MDB8798075.1 exopolysaccharide Pel transporter PelG [Romboutsia sp. 1001216sp1]